MTLVSCVDVFDVVKLIECVLCGSTGDSFSLTSHHFFSINWYLVNWWVKMNRIKQMKRSKWNFQTAMKVLIVFLTGSLWNIVYFKRNMWGLSTDLKGWVNLVLQRKATMTELESNVFPENLYREYYLPSIMIIAEVIWRWFSIWIIRTIRWPQMAKKDHQSVHQKLPTILKGAESFVISSLCSSLSVTTFSQIISSMLYF